MATELTTEQHKEIVATAGRYYRNTRYLMGVIFVVLGIWFAYDGFYNYPAENLLVRVLTSKLEAAEKAVPRNDKAVLDLRAQIGERRIHTDTDLMLQRGLGISLPPLGILLLAWWIYQSRGQIKLKGQTLHIPGHPPIHLNQIQKIDKTRWERKGIAYLEYQPNRGSPVTVKLDDFVYDAKPIREIFKQIEAHLTSTPAK